MKLFLSIIAIVFLFSIFATATPKPAFAAITPCDMDVDFDGTVSPADRNLVLLYIGTTAANPTFVNTNGKSWDPLYDITDNGAISLGDATAYTIPGIMGAICPAHMSSPTCSYSGPSPTATTGASFSLTYNKTAAGMVIGVLDSSFVLKQNLGYTFDSYSSPKTISATFAVAPGPDYKIYLDDTVECKGSIDIIAPGGTGTGSGTTCPTDSTTGGTPISSLFSPAKHFCNLGILSTDILTILVSAAGALSFIFIVIAGIKFVTAGGDPKGIESARSTLTYAIIGLSVTILAFIIVQVVQFFLKAKVV